MNLLRNKRGQGMTEYIIIVALIAIAAIAAFAYFGQTVRDQTAAMSGAIAGDEDTAQGAVDKAGEAAKDAAHEGQTERDLQTYVKKKAE